VSEGKTFFRLQEELGYGTSGKTSDAREKSRHRARKLRDKLEGTKDKKAVKESALNESEYSEVLTGYPNRGVDTDVEPVKYDADRLAKINGVLTALSRYTYQHTSEAMTRIRTRLNLFMLDFQWTPWKWQEGNTGVFTLDVVKFGRVDGVDAYTGEVRMDGRANPMSGFSEYTLTVNVTVSDNGLYSVQSNLQPKLSLVPEGTEADGDTIEEDLQTPARERDMEHAIQRAENKASRGYEAKMTKTGKAAARGRKQEAKHDAAARRLIKKDQKEYASSKLYGRGGKVVKEEAEKLTEVRKQMGSGTWRKSGSEFDKETDANTWLKSKGYKFLTTDDDGNSIYAKGRSRAYIASDSSSGWQVMVKEALIGGQKKLDVNKNKRLDSQDFKLLRAEKKPVQEQKKPWWMTSTAAELAAAAQSASDARRGEEAEKRKRHAQQNRRMKWTLADKAQGKKTVKEAAMGKPKKMKMLRKIKDGKVVSQRVIRIPDPTPKKS
jgi:hypothetical protein